MSKYFFSSENQSPWLIDIYNEYLPFKKNGFIVEIGVGHTLRNVDNVIPENINEISTCGSNSTDLINLGWSGIFIEPVYEYCEELKITHSKSLDRIKIKNVAASDEDSKMYLGLGDELTGHQTFSSKYNWIGREIETKKTSDILKLENCPNEFDILSIDVEGHEIKVLKGINFSEHSAKILIVETNVISESEIEKVIPNYYKKVNSDGLNTVWVKDI